MNSLPRQMTLFPVQGNSAAVLCLLLFLNRCPKTPKAFQWSFSGLANFLLV